MKTVRAVFLIAVVIGGFSLYGIELFGLTQDSKITVIASNVLSPQLETVADGKASFTNETVHSSPFSVKLIIPAGALQGSCAFALYPYNNTLNSISTFSFFASYRNAVPVFVFRLDKNGDGASEISLMSDSQFASNNEWKSTTGGERWGWTEAYNQLSVYGKTWNTLDYWKNLYGNATVLHIGIVLEYWAVEPNGFNEPLFADDLMVNGVTFNVAPSSAPSPPPADEALGVQVQSTHDGQALFTNEKTHKSPKSAKLVIPKNAAQGSSAMALYPYNGTLSSISTFSIVSSYVHAIPRFILCLDKNSDGLAETFLLSDYQFDSNGEWKATTGGNRWGWSETNMQLTYYGKTWEPLDFWLGDHGNSKVLFIGIVLEFWAIEPDGYGEPLYADELIVNGVTYKIATPDDDPNFGDSWPLFHKDLAHSGYSESAGPLTNQTLWKHQAGSGVESSPAVVGGVVYVGVLWNGQNGYVQALNATTGAKIWQFATNSGIESSPTVIDGVLYIGSYSGNVYALNASTGAQIWSFNTGGSVFPSPAVVDGMVFVGTAKGDIYALNASNGSPLWTYHTNGGVISSPAVIDGVVYVGSEDQNVYALRASDGTEIWHYMTNGYVDASPVIDRSIVYFGSRDGYVYALNATDGSRIWTFRPAHGNYGSYFYSTPAVANGVVYVGGYDSCLYALNATTGRVFWEFRIGGYIFSSPVVAGGVVYVGSFDGNVYALDAKTGGKIWSYQTGDKIWSSCCIVNGVAYVGSGDGYLYAFGSPIGQPASSYEISGYILDAKGQGITGANVIFNVPSIVPSVYSDASGYYVISAPAGTYNVNVWPPFDSTYIHFDEPGFVVASDLTKNITLYSGYKVSGCIAFSNGTPVVGAAVLLRNSAGMWFGSGWFSNSSGYYFLNVPVGTYTIDAHPRTGYNYAGPTTNFLTYIEHNFTVNSNTDKNITVDDLSSTPLSTSASTPTSSSGSSTSPSLPASSVSAQISDPSDTPLPEEPIVNVNRKRSSETPLWGWLVTAIAIGIISTVVGTGCVAVWRIKKQQKTIDPA